MLSTRVFLMPADFGFNQTYPILNSYSIHWDMSDLNGLILLIPPSNSTGIVELEGGFFMTMLEQMNSHIPEYYPTMYLDGYEPWQILVAARKAMNR